MPAIGFTPDLTQIMPAHITQWTVTRGLEEGEGTYSIIPLQDGAKIDVKSFQDQDSFARDRPFAVDIQATGKMMKTPLAVIKILPKLNDTFMAHAIYFGAAKNIHGAFGLKWKLMSDADLDKSRYTELTADMGILLDSASEYDLTDLLSSAPQDTEQAAPDVLYPLAAAAEPAPAGFKEFKVSDGGSLENVGAVRKGKLTCESVTQLDGQRRSIATGSIKVSAEVELMQTKAELAFLKSLKAPVNYSIKLQDGVTFTLGSNLGIAWNLNVVGSVDDMTTIKIMGNGIVDTAAWSGLWS